MNPVLHPQRSIADRYLIADVTIKKRYATKMQEIAIIGELKGDSSQNQINLTFWKGKDLLHQSGGNKKASGVRC